MLIDAVKSQTPAAESKFLLMHRMTAMTIILTSQVCQERLSEFVFSIS